MRIVFSDRYKDRNAIAFDEDNYELVCDGEVNGSEQPFIYEDYGSDNGQGLPYEYLYVVEIDADKPVNVRQDLLLGYGDYAEGQIVDQTYGTSPTSFDWSSDDLDIKFGCGVGDKDSATNGDPFSDYIYGARYHEDMLLTNYTLALPFSPTNDHVNVYAVNMMNGDYYSNLSTGLATKIYVGKSDDDTKARVRVWRKIGSLATARK